MTHPYWLRTAVRSLEECERRHEGMRPSDWVKLACIFVLVFLMGVGVGR